MKRLPAIFILFMALTAGSVNAGDIYVAVNGSDQNTGTKESPLASVAAALRKAREWRRLQDAEMTGGIHIIVGAGLYQLYEPLFIRPEDAGTETSPTWIEAAPGQQPVLSGGYRITGWHKLQKKIPGLPASTNGQLWMAELPADGVLPAFRQLWIDNVKATRAKSTPGAVMDRILSWNDKEQSCWIPLRHSLPKDINGMEMFIHQWWAIAILRIKKTVQQGDSAKLYFKEPETSIQSQHPWPAPWISSETGNSAFYLTNHIHFLDEPGEWYLDAENRTLYYWPRRREDMRKAVVMAPAIETLVTMQGTAEKPIGHVFFKGISFAHTGWLRPSLYGAVPHQAGMYMLDAYKLQQPGTADKKTLENQAWVGRPSAAVSVSYADNTGFYDCRFEHLAATGLDYAKYTHNNMVQGNLFKDIGGSALLAGVFSDEAVEVHLPYNPTDKLAICRNLTISNNLVTDATNEDWGCVGIGAGYVQDIHIIHNEISNLSYTGISLGWGWTKTVNAMQNNEVRFNYIHHYGKHNYDCAGVYTLSAQPGTIISSNCIDSIYVAQYAHLPNHWFYLYTDEGSSGITLTNNWCPSEKFLQNANGPGNSWTNNGPQAGLQVKQTAGLDAAHQYLAQEEAIDKTIAINKEQPVIIELTADRNHALDKQQLVNWLAHYHISAASLYQWQEHYVIFDRIADAYTLLKKMKETFPLLQIKTYDNIYYEFNRSHCADTTNAAEWEHTILSASLVADPGLQKEYFAYHANQFQQWPEVSNGFCQAGFQRLLAYKNGRQLMLVISIPKGQRLDDLNPKTTAGNPRMNEWNQLMQKYQQGIEGTKKGETWVFFNPLTP